MVHKAHCIGCQFPLRFTSASQKMYQNIMGLTILSTTADVFPRSASAFFHHRRRLAGDSWAGVRFLLPRSSVPVICL